MSRVEISESEFEGQFSIVEMNYNDTCVCANKFNKFIEDAIEEIYIIVRVIYGIGSKTCTCLVAFDNFILSVTALPKACE